jgi:hypothetical protein
MKFFEEHLASIAHQLVVQEDRIAKRNGEILALHAEHCMSIYLSLNILLTCLPYHRYTTCGPSVFNAQSGDATECCPGRSCREVEAYVNGGIGMKSVCVSSTATKRDNYGLGFPSLERDAEPALALNGTADERDHHLEKRVVVKFCYSKCQASSFTKTI